MKIELTNDNYFSPEAMSEFWSVSQFKAFNKCEAAGLAESRGQYQREKTDALLIGSYIDAYFSGSEEFNRFWDEYGDDMVNHRTGELLAKYTGVKAAINRVEGQPVLMDYLEGEKQKIFTAELFGVPWKIKMDVYHPERIVDLKYVRDFNDIYDPGYGYRSWLEYWGYDIQGAIYTRIEQLATGRKEPLPFYLLAVTKEKVPDAKLIQIPEHILQAALGLVEAKIDRFDMIKHGEVEPIRCEKCDFCKQTKIITGPEIYEVREAED